MTFCAWCDRKFENEEQLTRHIRRKGRHGHGDLICNNCKQPLSKCADIDGVTGGHQCIAAEIARDAKTLEGETG